MVAVPQIFDRVKSVALWSTKKKKKEKKDHRLIKGYGSAANINQDKKKNMCVYGHPTHPIFQPLTLTFFYRQLFDPNFANNPINFYTEFG